ncbi:putative esterase [Halapricum desulfuricans]|uniref:Putative esterase n=1 Tax=Halapricum desulfuricans TaxID=2841257 RepID=A0A897N218_9EURY|nr:putative esterase [Halapricum desulfuricans]
MYPPVARSVRRRGVAYLAPQAAGNTWYPDPFTAPVEPNEPGRTSALRAIDDATATAEAAGVARDRIVVHGFSEEACLASESVARNPDRYGGLVALGGRLIGESIAPDEYEGDLEGTPVFIGVAMAIPTSLLNAPTSLRAFSNGSAGT